MTPSPPSDSTIESSPVESTDAGQRTAAIILQVLAGMYKPSEAAGLLNIAVPRYYQLELRAIDGMVAACQPRPKGPQPSLAKENQRLRQQVTVLQRELTRTQALARAAQRSMGLVQSMRDTESPPVPGKRRRRPTVRAMRMAERLMPKDPSPPVMEDSTKP